MRIACQPRRLALSACALLAAMLMTAAPARAEDAGHKVIRLCAEGKSLSGYPPSDYARALKEISPTTEEYSECGQLIRQAQAAAASGHGGAPSPTEVTGAVQTSPAEQQAISSAARTGSTPVEVSGQAVHPGVVHANVASALSTLPTPLLVLLAFVLACVAVFAGNAARKRIRGERPD